MVRVIRLVKIILYSLRKKSAIHIDIIIWVAKAVLGVRRTSRVHIKAIASAW